MMRKKDKEKVNKKALDKRNYFFFALFGVILIGVLMILQTRFREYFRMYNDGFAIVSNTVTEYLNMKPGEEPETVVEMEAFQSLDWLYSQGGKFFLGKKSKTAVDTSYPVYMHQGAVLQLTEGTGILFDEDYDRVETYKGMYLEGGYAYNLDGEKADPCQYTFLGMNNGNFVNFERITYKLKGEELDINENSLVHFEADYFAYYEYENGELLYKYCISVNDSFKLKVGDLEYTYDQLLRLLGLRSDYPEIDGILNKDEETEEEDIQDTSDAENETTPSATVEINKSEKQKPQEPSQPTHNSGGANSNTSPGVRPPGITRPGSTNDTENQPEPVQGYVKPQVTIHSVTANVYRILVDATISDPAGRIDTGKYVRFEVFELDADDNEQLTMRGYRRGEGRTTTTLGGGAIKPDTRYRVKSYYTYYDEYNNEQYVDLGSWDVTTGEFEDLSDITLVHEQGNSYNNHIEVVNFGYDASVSDEELIYGINPYSGIKFTVKEKNSGITVTSRNLTTTEINLFKNNRGVTLNSLNTLRAKTEYIYEFEAQDFFGNEITLLNNCGSAMTSNNAPGAIITEKVNEIGNVVLGITIEDIDAAAVPSLDENDAADACDVYLILTKEDPARLSGQYENFEQMEEAGVITAYRKLSAGEYAYSESTGLTTPSEVEFTFDDLRLGEKFYAAVYADYDLSNRMGPQYFKNIGQTSFVTTDLNSLGKIYVTSDLDLNNLTCSSLPMSFHLNSEATNAQLCNLITGMKIEIVRGNGRGDDAIIDATFSFDENMYAADNTTKVLDMFKDTAVSYLAENLQSMTEYRINATIYARYQGEEYEITPKLTNYTFKTLRKPAEVTVENLLFAAGTLVFDTKISDPDDTIIGVSGDKVVIQLYKQNGEFVKTVRVYKDLEDYQTVTFYNLDPEQKYELRFVAVEYNEGYTNAKYVSNKILKVVNVDQSLSLEGTIKLQAIKSILDDNNHYEAVVKATLNDSDHMLTGENAIPYYIKVEKDGVLVEDVPFDLSEETPSSYIEKFHNYTVDKGEYTYKLTMYIIVSERVVELDTLTFTTETTVKGFSTAYEMISMIKADSDGKYVALNSFVLNSNTWNYKDVIDPGDVDSLSAEEKRALGTGISGSGIVNIFDGEIDFQGFTLYHNGYKGNKRMFTSIGSKGVIRNMVYEAKNLSTVKSYNDGMMCYYNFGTISDIYIKYRGGYLLDNEIFSLLARSNASTGIIENFVLEIAPDEGFSSFSAYRWCGVLTEDNYGIVRYGYAFGENVILTTVSESTDREVGTMVGSNKALGEIYSVYSLVNVDDTKTRPAPYENYTYSNWYGAVCGQSVGKVSNMYSAKDSAFVENKSGTGGVQLSPILGNRKNSVNSNIYYYSENSYPYASSIAVKSADLNQLYDVTWQSSILTDRFDTSLVEVGYYPHVKLSEDLPEQPYIPLPTRTMEQPVEISRATVLDYGIMSDGATDYATVEFVFVNRDGLDVVGITIEDIDVELDLSTAKYEDGYTTIKGVVSNPRTFYSEYEIKSIQYYKNGRLTSNAQSYILQADFFRKIYNADDWYNYMVNRRNAAEFENVRLEADIDFEGVDPSRIMVTQTFNRILDGTDSYGNMHTLKNINLQYGFRETKNTTYRRLFNNSLTYSGVVRNLYIDNYLSGGSYYSSETGKTYMAKNGGVFGSVFGKVENVHLSNANIISFEYASGLVCYLQSSGEMKDCSVTNLTIHYTDPDDVNSTSYVGGVVARMGEARLSHCYAQNIDIQVDETKSTYGIGGVVGYANESVIDTAYAEGTIISRSQKVGGVAGQYYSTNACVACMKNMWAKVDIICYTDVAGGLVGQTNITQERISATNNFTGIGIGNVYLSNLDSANCSQTIGYNLGKNVMFYGTTQQLINGISGVGYAGKEDCVRGLLSYDDLINNAAESYYNVVGFENVYSMEGTDEGLLPKMYYTDSKELLPNQTDIVLDDLLDVDIRVTNVIHNDVDRIVTVELYNPNNYKITGINIRDLKYHFVDMTAGQSHYGDAVTIDRASDYDSGYTRIYLQYDEEQSQDYFLDSYVLDNITFYPVNNSGLNTGLASSSISADSLRNITIYSRINVMLCKNIPTVGEWNRIPIREQEGHIYENYRITGELDFNNVETASDLKIGRLISDNGERTISNISLSGYDKHLLARLNSGIKGLKFDNIKISSNTVGCVGIIGVSNGTVLDCEFTNIIISPQSKDTDEVGIIGHSNGGAFENITLKNIEVNKAAKASIDYVGGLAGRILDGSTFKNITAQNIDVTGTAAYAGGVVGQAEMADVSDVSMKDIIVTNSGNCTGGFGGDVGTNGNSSGKTFINIELVGTPVYDEDGRVVDSTTVISGNNFVGGISGNSYQKVGTGYQESRQEPFLNVEGVVVCGTQNMGGAFGYTNSAMYNLTVKNSLIKSRDSLVNKKNVYPAIGGALGQSQWSATRGVLVDNVVIDVENARYVGGAVGLYRYATAQHVYVNNCLIKVTKKGDMDLDIHSIGGLIGQYENYASYCGVSNTIIDAPDYANVGGIIGTIGTSITSAYSLNYSYYLCDYDTEAYLEYNSGGGDRYTAASIDKYYIKGKTKVGGIVGSLIGGTLTGNYSNANVIAANQHIAGGIVGLYNNQYVTSVSGGKVNYTYGASGIARNYFAGTVTAVDGYAGGAIGRCGILYNDQGTGEHRENGNRIKYVNSNVYEEDKTYGNIVIADRIVGGTGTTGAFAADDTSFVFIGRDNRIWDKTIVNDGTGDTYAADIVYNGNYAYTYWRDKDDNGTILSYNPLNLEEMQVFESSDMDGSKITSQWHNRTALFYRTAGWGLAYTSDASQDYVKRDSLWRISVGDVPTESGGTRGLKNIYEATGSDTGTYLPQIRESVSRAYKIDTHILKQEAIARLPLPRDKGDVRTAALSSGYSFMDLDTTYGMVYPQDIDTINVEFSKDLTGSGYFILKMQDKVIKKALITERTYSFKYPYNCELTLEYGFLEDTSLSEDELLKDENLNEEESVLLTATELKSDIMVYHNDYYYITEEGLVSSAGTWAGEFIHVMNGKVLDKEGNIYDVEKRTKTGTVTGITECAEAQPLWTFTYGPMEILTYAKYSAVGSEYSTIERNAQIFVKNDKIYTVDGTLDTRKTDILIYTLNGEEYQTVLGTDGMMVDMFNEDFNIPSEVSNSGIVRMSNTLNASVPYVLIEYNDGGIVGYNYATGEILFDNSVDRQLSLWEYAQNFFQGKQESAYANISSSYQANSDLSKKIHSSGDLKKIVGISSDELITGNGEGENTSPSTGEQSMADKENAQNGQGVTGIGDESAGQGHDEGEYGNDPWDENPADENVSEFENSDKDSENEDGCLEEKDDTINETDKNTEENTQENAGKNTSEGSGREEVSGNKENSSIKEEKTTSDTVLDIDKYMTVYNNETGVYEIVNIAKYLTEDAYISENHSLGVQDLSKYASGYAQSKMDVNQERGIFIYIIPVIIILGITGAIVVYVRKKERKSEM